MTDWNPAQKDRAKMRCVPRSVGRRRDRPFFQKKVSNAVISWMTKAKVPEAQGRNIKVQNQGPIPKFTRRF